MSDEQLISYWQWLFKGSGARPGYRRILDKWLLMHIPIGVILSLLTSLDLQACANAVLLPLAGILIGLSFAWAGNAHALLQTEEHSSAWGEFSTNCATKSGLYLSNKPPVDSPFELFSPKH